ncbi:MAG TPA: hypothetical protein VKS60_06950 [Stellaceae bacterium]|nr:hypothetical protein [Stellaceae bacterium]
MATILDWAFFILPLDIAAAVIVFGPLAIFRRARYWAAWGLYATSIVAGVILWIYCAAITFWAWGWVGLIIGIVILGVGVLPLGLVAALIYHLWQAAAVILVTALFVYGSRLVAITADSQGTTDRSDEHDLREAADDDVSRPDVAGGWKGEQPVPIPVECPYRDRSLHAFPSLFDGQPLNTMALRCCRATLRGWDFLMVEPPLCAVPDEIEIYRFTWRPAFRGDTVITIGKDSRGITLAWRHLEVRFSPERVGHRNDVPEIDWEALKAAVLAAGFWGGEFEVEQFGFEGARWLFEGRRGAEFQAVQRLNPSAELEALGRLFLRLAGPVPDTVQLQ